MLYDDGLTKVAESLHHQLKGHVLVAYDPDCKHDYECHKRPSELKVLIVLRDYQDTKLWRNAVASAVRLRRGISLADEIRGRAH